MQLVQIQWPKDNGDGQITLLGPFHPSFMVIEGSTEAKRVYRGGRQTTWQCKSLGRVAHGDEGRGPL